MSERELHRHVLHLAKLGGWLSYHTFDSRRSADGFPDLAMVRKGHLILAELKSATGVPRPEQETWLKALEQVERLTVRLWRPDDLAVEIASVLVGGG